MLSATADPTAAQAVGIQPLRTLVMTEPVGASSTGSPPPNAVPSRLLRLNHRSVVRPILVTQAMVIRRLLTSAAARLLHPDDGALGDLAGSHRRSGD
jgi:hypothetical protein